MRRAIGAGETRAIEAKVHREIQDAHIMYNLVIGSLHEGGINIAEGNKPLCGQTGGECYSVLFGNSHVESPVRHLPHHDVHGRSRRHGGCDTDYFVVAPGQFNQCMTKNILVLRRLRTLVSLLVDFTRDLVECPRRMPGGGVAFFGGGESLALDGDAVKDLRSLNILQIAEDGYQMIYIMAVDRTEIPQIQRFKKIALCQQGGLDPVLELGDDLLSTLSEIGKLAEQFPYVVLDLVISARRCYVCEIVLQCPDIRVDGHTIVVEDDQQVCVRNTRVIHSLESDPARHCAIAYNGNMLTVLVF